jgi:hypothetical protein
MASISWVNIIIVYLIEAEVIVLTVMSPWTVRINIPL